MFPVPRWMGSLKISTMLGVVGTSVDPDTGEKAIASGRERSGFVRNLIRVPLIPTNELLLVSNTDPAGMENV